MMLVACHIARSPIEGLGLFATRFVPAGAEVWRFDPVFDVAAPRAALEAAPEPLRGFFGRFGYEMAILPDHVLLDGDDGRFMNHSDDPNVDLSRPGQAFAARDIRAGEEMTCDYRLLTSEPLVLEGPRLPL
jgi:hypothetical protein